MPPAKTIDIAALTEGPAMTALTKRVLVLCFLLMMTDLYDSVSLAFAAPQIIATWHVSKLTMGSIFSAGLFGLMIGSFLFGYLGDRFGRKNAVIVGTLSFGIFTLLTAWAASVPQLYYLRFLAGIGIGGAVPNAVALTNEFSPKRFRVTAVALIFAGYTLGGSGGGFVSAALIPSFGWPVVFVVGGVVPIVLSLILIVALPESIKYLALFPERQAQAARIAARMRPDLPIGPETRVVLGQAEPKAKFLIKDLFSGPRLAMTPLLWVIYIANSIVVFGLSNWLPVLIEGAGLPPRSAALAASVYSIGGAIGGLVAARFIDRRGLLMLLLFPAIGCPIIAALGYVGAAVVVMFTVLAFAGFFVVGTQNCLHGVAGSIYPTEVRSNGVGWALGIGKIGSIAGPFIAGVLLSRAVTVQHLFLVSALPLVVVVVAAFLLMRLYNAHVYGQPDPETAATGTSVPAQAG